jgi:hypothetical protein
MATLAGVLPFLIIGLGTILTESPHTWALHSTISTVGRVFYMGGYLVLVVGAGIGWVKGFPRWALPYLGYALIFAPYMTQVATPGLRIFGHDVFGRELWGWRAWIPLWIMVATALLITRFSLRPLLQLVKTGWKDWTCLSFGLYGAMPFVVRIAFDEVDNSFQFPFMVVLTLILSGGALAYMRGIGARQRASALMISTTAFLVITTMALAIYWNMRVEPWMRDGPDRWYDVLRWSVPAGVILLAIIFAPALLELLRRTVRSLGMA